MILKTGSTIWQRQRYIVIDVIEWLEEIKRCEKCQQRPFARALNYWYTKCFIYYRKSLLQITQPSQYRCTSIQYIFAVISEAPSTLFFLGAKLLYKPVCHSLNYSVTDVTIFLFWHITFYICIDSFIILHDACLVLKLYRFYLKSRLLILETVRCVILPTFSVYLLICMNVC